MKREKPKAPKVNKGRPAPGGRAAGRLGKRTEAKKKSLEQEKSRTKSRRFNLKVQSARVDLLGDSEVKAPAPTYRWFVKRSEQEMSLENFLYSKLGEWSHKQVKDAIDRKRAFVNGKNVFVTKWQLKRNDLVVFSPAASDVPKTQVSGRYKFVDVLYDDNYIVCANKPAFVDHEAFALSVQAFMARQTSAKVLPYVGQMHRLDKETSGIMIFTKKKSANNLAEQFREHTIRKTYLAIVEGLVEREHGVIKKPIEKGQFDEGRKVRIAQDGEEGQRAVTIYNLVERYEDASLLRVEIETGRTHQIRIHMSDLGHPLVGDKLYGGKPREGFRRQALHAETLEFKHPITHKRMKVSAALPKDFVGLLSKLRGVDE